MRVQAASTTRASTCHETGLSDVRRAEAVSTTTVANAGDNSTLGADAMHATLPLKKAASPGRGRWDAISCRRVECEWTAVAPVAADATEWARTCCALSTTRNTSRAAIFAFPISSSNRRRCASRRRIIWLASTSARWARTPACAKSNEPTAQPRSREPWGWRSAESGEPRWRRLCPVESGGGGNWWRSPEAGESWCRDAPESGGGWSVLFSARIGESTLWVGGFGWWYGGPSSVSSPEPASGDSPRLESRGLERALPVSLGIQVGARGKPHPAPSSPLPKW